ncbi:hypothetical protein GNF18_03395 [Ligilactobacillus pobuzihii]|uniref:hypothetical protein n=1 Tax=Ligilactobacillus pobuzihii TaxID=449659 RepID=UPI0019D2C001|nr:hypothetical protein [Ligilactobacillus pobuzihii]MBN7274208.1 hypothetical protein [Ligilactobacillus pobuzihii]
MKSRLNASHEKKRSVQVQLNVSRQKERPVQAQLNASQKHATVIRISQIITSLFSTVLSVPTIKNIAALFLSMVPIFWNTFKGPSI